MPKEEPNPYHRNPPPPQLLSTCSDRLTSLREMSISTAKLVMWLHWQLTWVSFLKTTSHPLADQPPIPLILGKQQNEDDKVGTKCLYFTLHFPPKKKCISLRHFGVRNGTHRMEWFQKTQMGLVRSSVSSRRNCTVIGFSRARCIRASLSWMFMLTTGVLMMGRLGTLGGTHGTD